MRQVKRLATISLLSCAFAVGLPTVLNADPTPSPSPSSSLDPYKSAQEQFKRDRETYMQSLRDRDIKMRLINFTFKNSVDKAAADARAAMSTAITPEQKSSISTIRRNAIAQAIAVRDAAILALGPFPTPPAKPEKLGHEKSELKIESKSDQKGKQKR
jgi:hypothetical protein